MTNDITQAVDQIWFYLSIKNVRFSLHWEKKHVSKENGARSNILSVIKNFSAFTKSHDTLK